MYNEEIPYDIEDIERLSPNEKRANWNVAFGLQAVDGLAPSKYMVGLAEEHIAGRKTYAAIAEEINDYYSDTSKDKDEKEADIVSHRISLILAKKAFTLSPVELRGIHGDLFSGVLEPGIPIGKYRTYNISKAERVLSGGSVLYSDASRIEETLAYDFREEKDFDYADKTAEAAAHHAMRFVSGIWQIHPFGEGNTRACAVFAIKYLRTLGFNVENEPFRAHSKYFRDALVMDNCGNNKTPKYLKMFTDNLLLSGSHNLDQEIPAVGATASLIHF